MRNRPIHSGMLAACLLLLSCQAAAVGFGRCEEGYADGTRVRTEARGDMTIGDVRVNDRVWSLNKAVGKPGWSTILKRVDEGRHYKLLVDFSEPGSRQKTQACWRIARAD